MMIRKLLISGIGFCALALAVLLLWPSDSKVSESTTAKEVGSLNDTSPRTAATGDTGNSTPVASKSDTDSAKSDESDATYTSVMDAADDLARCTDDGSCIADDQSDPRAGHMQTVGKLSQTLDTLIQAAQTDGSAPQAQLGSFARRMLAFPDGHVQARAISLMGAMAPQPQNVDSIVTHLNGHHDAALFELGLAELGRYAGAGGDAPAKIDALLADTLKSGGHYAAQTVATNVGKLIHPGNVEKFEALARELPAQTRTAKILKSTLAEYRAVASGG